MSIPQLLFVSRRTEASVVRYTTKIENYSCIFMGFASPLLALCVRSIDNCGGNQCCPGFEGSLNKPFSCPNADDNFDRCETDFKDDHRSAFRLNFNNIVYAEADLHCSYRFCAPGICNWNYVTVTVTATVTVTVINPRNRIVMVAAAWCWRHGRRSEGQRIRENVKEYDLCPSESPVLTRIP